MIDTDGGFDAFAQEAAQINTRQSAFRGTLAEDRATNLQLQQQSRTSDDLDTLRNIGEEFSLKGLKDLVGRYGSKAYKYKEEGGTSFEDLDYRFGDDVVGGLKRIGKNVVSGVGRAEDTLSDLGQGFSNEVSNLSTNMGSLFSSSRGRVANSLNEGGLGDAPVLTSQSTPPMEEWEAPSGNRVNRVSSVAEEEEGTEMSPMSSEALGDQTEIGQYEKDVSSAEEKAKEEGGQLIGQDGKVEEDFTKDGPRGGVGGGGEAEEEDGVVDTITEGTTEEEVAGGLEGVGAGLDATGVLAPVGALFGAIGAGLDLFAGVEAGKSVVDWFETDILHTKQPPAPPQIQLPNQPQTIAQRGFGITPNMDTLNLTGNAVSSSW